ncbi:MAG: cardiolipin synthase [Rhodocyclales bacterium]|nr:cardiolipin synthase [Rhodocyclales bacterium]
MNAAADRGIGQAEAGRGWKPGHKIRLLENGEEYFPRVFEAIRAARCEVLIETFILFQDKIGNELHAAVIDAAKRGVRVELTVDGYGSPDLDKDFIAAMTDAGVTLHIFDPKPRLLGMRTNVFRRLHRKLVVIDRERVFVGGINFSHDHVADFGPAAKQDYAVEIEGPVVEDIRLFMESALSGKAAKRRRRSQRQQSIPVDSAGSVLFATRDNDRHPTDIEQHYREAIRSARREVIIANAYFFPGFRLLRELRLAARRGVRVMLILQGEPDMAMAKWAPRMLFGYLLKAGVEIHEYCERPLHGKVAVVDAKWSTVGSSNLDPLSLSFNLESNVFILDRAFSRHLHERLEVLMRKHCKQFKLEHIERSNWQAFMSFLAFHFMRHFPVFAGWVPVRAPRMETMRANAAVVAEEGASMADSGDAAENANSMMSLPVEKRRVQELQA